MKKMLLSVSVAMMALLFNSCKDKTLEIEFPEFATGPYVISGDIPACGGPIDTTVISSFSVNIDSLIKSNTNGKLGVNNISTMYPTEAIVMNITNADSANNFSNVEGLAAAIYTNALSTQSPFLAYLSIPDTYSTNLDLSSNVNYATDIRPYVSSNSSTTFYYGFNFKMRRATTQTIHFTMAVKFKIKAKA
jgi:hypothetical protein